MSHSQKDSNRTDSRRAAWAHSASVLNANLQQSQNKSLIKTSQRGLTSSKKEILKGRSAETKRDATSKKADVSEVHTEAPSAPTEHLHIGGAGLAGAEEEQTHRHHGLLAPVRAPTGPAVREAARPPPSRTHGHPSPGHPEQKRSSHRDALWPQRDPATSHNEKKTRGYPQTLDNKPHTSI